MHIPALGLMFLSWTLTLSPAAAQDPAPAAEAGIESRDILAREPVTDNAQVQHVLVAWKDLSAAYRGSMDARASRRSQEDAEKLALEIHRKAKEGEDFAAMMQEYSEDPGSATTGRAYNATPTSRLVPPFKKLSLRLEVGEVGIVRTAYGYHIIKRVR